MGYLPFPFILYINLVSPWFECELPENRGYTFFFFLNFIFVEKVKYPCGSGFKSFTSVRLGSPVYTEGTSGAQLAMSSPKDEQVSISVHLLLYIFLFFQVLAYANY